MLAAPEFVVAERIELLDQIEVAAELQHRVLADRVVRGEEGAEFEACHEVSLRYIFVVAAWFVERPTPKLRRGNRQGNRRKVAARHASKLRRHAAARTYVGSSPVGMVGGAGLPRHPV